jgi:DNA-3-methyladenine glycosylase II
MSSKILFSSDSKLQQLYEQVTEKFGDFTPLTPANPDQYFGKLCESIISQQLSTKVADVIEARVRTLLGGSWTYKSVIATEAEALRGAGLSYAKINYIKNIAEAWQSGAVNSEKLQTQTDEEVITELVKIKGVGRWTAEMFLIFTLGRSDIYSAGDYGLKKAVCKLYGLEMTIKPKELIQISNQWAPHRSLASRILWKSLEIK